MPVDAKPIFRPEALRAKIINFVRPVESLQAKADVIRWNDMLAAVRGDDFNETELLPEFLSDIFIKLLGYTRRDTKHSAFTFRRESLIQVDGKRADAALGQFDRASQAAQFEIVLEGKGPRDPLDRPFAGRRRSAVEQALQYAVNLEIDWFVVTNFREFRLYHKGHDLQTYERFELARLATDDDELKRFVYLLGAGRVLAATGNQLSVLLNESAKLGRELTNDYYREYKDLRQTIFDKLRDANPDIPPTDVLAATQKILDRVLFIAFGEKRGLLPRNSIAEAFRHRDQYRPRPIWDNFLALFDWINEGNAEREIAKYNGGLFASDKLLESLKVPDVACRGFDRLATYEYGFESNDPNAQFVDVEILGHIFEQSISDLEEMQKRLIIGGEEPSSKPTPTKRKKEGAFYTPAFITRYIVQATLGPILTERFETHRQAFQQATPKPMRYLLDDPKATNPSDLKLAERRILAKFWNSWHVELRKIRVVDPACGSGAFLIEAFELLAAEYYRAVGHVRDFGEPELFDIDREILESNLFGVDLNSEAVEICRLSLWIKTARQGKVLTSLDHNIQIGNSVVANPKIHPLAFDWKGSFPEIFADGGFDVVIGNPPYVRQEWLAPFKDYWKEAFESYDSVADLFVYFYELGVKLLRPHGRLGFITSGSWVRGSYGEGLRGFLAKNVGIESMIDFGEFQPFEDAEMIRPTIAVLNRRRPGGSMKIYKWLTAGKPPETLSHSVSASPSMRTSHLRSTSWELEPDKVIDLRQKLTSKRKDLSTYVDGKLYRGVTTGLNEAFVIDDESRKSIITFDKASDRIIKPFVQGTHLRPWHIEHSGEYLIFPRRGIRIEEYKGVLSHLSKFKESLAPKPDDWPAKKKWSGRKPGQYQWFEIQDSVDYWEAFEQPKIVWPDICKLPRFSMDSQGRFLGNTSYIIPSEDYYLLAVLSSWATWFVISKTAQPLRLRGNRWQYRLIAQFMEKVPIPDAGKTDRKVLAELARKCNDLGNNRYLVESHVQGRLTQVFAQKTIGESEAKLNEKASEWWSQPLNELGSSLKTSFDLSANPFSSPKVADEWDAYLKSKRSEREKLDRELNNAESEINDRVFRLFELTADEIKLLQREVEH